MITPPKVVADSTGADALSPEQQSDVDQAILQCQPPLNIDLSMGEEKRVDQMANLPLNPVWHKQVRILFRRNLREQSRRLNLIFTSIMQTIIMAVLIGTVFPHIGHAQDSIIRRQPVIFFCIINQGVFGALTVINSFPVERTLTLRERASGTYFASAYFIAKIVADTLVQVPIPIIFVSLLCRLSKATVSPLSFVSSRASSTFSLAFKPQRPSSLSSLSSCCSARSPRPRWL